MRLWLCFQESWQGLCSFSSLHLCSASAAELQPCPSQTTERPFQVEQSSFAKVSRLSYLCHLTDPGREFQKIQLK